MRLFLDTNVILDIFMRREPFYAASAQVVYLCESGKHIGSITTLTACNVVYALRKRIGLVKTIGAIKQACQKGFLRPGDKFFPAVSGSCPKCEF